MFENGQKRDMLKPVRMTQIGFSLLLSLLMSLAVSCGNRSTAAPDALSKAQPNDAMNDSKKPTQDDLRKKLDPLQFAVTQQCGTEPPFRNAYWDNHKPGIYVDVISGKPLFSS